MPCRKRTCRNSKSPWREAVQGGQDADDDMRGARRCWHRLDRSDGRVRGAAGAGCCHSSGRLALSRDPGPHDVQGASVVRAWALLGASALLVAASTNRKIRGRHGLARPIVVAETNACAGWRLCLKVANLQRLLGDDRNLCTWFVSHRATRSGDKARQRCRAVSRRRDAGRVGPGRIAVPDRVRLRE